MLCSVCEPFFNENSSTGLFSRSIDGVSTGFTLPKLEVLGEYLCCCCPSESKFTDINNSHNHLANQQDVLF